MTAPERALDDTHPYTDSDIERVRPSQIRRGDLLAMRGPVGSERWSGNPVLNDASYAGTDYTGHDETYHIEYVDPWRRELYFDQPNRMFVGRIKADRRRDQRQ